MTSTVEVTQSTASKAGTGVVGVLVALWTFVDGLIIGLPIALAALGGQALLAFVVGGVIWALTNLWVCGWINRKWDLWIAGSKVEARLQKLRDGKRAKRPVEWIVNGSNRMFAVAALALSAGQAIILYRLATGAPASSDQRRWASVVPAVVFGGLFALVGYLFRRGVEAAL